VGTPHPRSGQRLCLQTHTPVAERLRAPSASRPRARARAGWFPGAGSPRQSCLQGLLVPQHPSPLVACPALTGSRGHSRHLKQKGPRAATEPGAEPALRLGPAGAPGRCSLRLCRVSPTQCPPLPLKDFIGFATVLAHD
jgi:hypothetical protein